MQQLTKRRLTDLWVVGREMTFDDGGGGVTVWLQKMNPVEAADTSKRCDAARARIVAMRRDHESREWEATRAAVLDLGDDRAQLIDSLVLEDRARSVRLHEARNGADDEWAKDNYLQGLRDSWEDGLKSTYAEDPEDSEAKRVFEEMKRFTDAVDAAVEADQADAKAALAEVPLGDLQDRMCERLLEMDGNQAWLGELHRCQIYFGTREGDNHKLRYFTSRSEVDDLGTTIYTRLRTAYENLEVDAAEGKDSGVTPPSSPSPASPATVETPTSGLVSATA